MLNNIKRRSYNSAVLFSIFVQLIETVIETVSSVFSFRGELTKLQIIIIISVRIY